MPTQEELLKIMKNASINKTASLVPPKEKGMVATDMVVTIPKENLRPAKVTSSVNDYVNDSDRLLNEILIQLKGMNTLLRQIRNNALGIPTSPSELNDEVFNGQ